MIYVKLPADYWDGCNSMESESEYNVEQASNFFGDKLPGKYKFTPRNEVDLPIAIVMKFNALH
jgi:hypothetical protein